MFTITERIHHGDYVNVRQVTASTVDRAAAQAVSLSPYNASTLDAATLAAGLTATAGPFEFGWATYTLDAHDDAQDLPPIGTHVVRYGRGGKLMNGDVIDHRDDGMYRFFVVEYGEDLRVEYAAGYWMVTVFPRSCRFCDSPHHYSADEGECRHHFA